VTTSPAPDLDEFSSLLHDPTAPWREHNDAGLALALAGQWDAAAASFDAALALAPSLADGPDVHALLHSNRAQAHFHLGERLLAVEAARRSLMARLICGDEGDAPMARIRADLAVYLAACGAHEEADATLRRARTTLEDRFGDEDVRLASLLENEARLALLVGQPAHAEPALLRLHALVEEAGADPASLAPLFEAVRAARYVPPEPAAVGEAVVETESAEEAVMETESALEAVVETEFAEETVVEAQSAEAELDATDLFPVPAQTDSLLADEFDLVDDSAFPPLRSPSPAAIRHAGLIEPGSHATPAPAATRTHPLGFEIQYGVPQELLMDGNAD
jgi:tetratricopeptide (TPR) repeat protein